MRSPKQLVTNQHYCPRFYLRGFSFKDSGGAKKLWRYGLEHQRFDRRPRGVGSICSANNFYDVELECVSDQDIQFVDEALSSLEDRTFAPKLKALLDSNGTMGIATEDRKAWSWILITQRYRTPAARQFLADVECAGAVEVLPQFFGEEYRLELSAQDEAAVHAAFWTRDIVHRIVEELTHRFRWIVVHNTTSIPFITSDNPVAFTRAVRGRNGQYAGQHAPNFGACHDDAVHFFPLSSSIGLVVLRPTLAAVMGFDAPTISVSDQAWINWYNERQLLSARQYVLGPDRTHMEQIGAHAQHLKDLNPDLWAGARDPRRAMSVQGRLMTPQQVQEQVHSAKPIGLTFDKNAKPPRRRKLGRNERCWCGSGIKYKHCHLQQDNELP